MSTQGARGGGICDLAKTMADPLVIFLPEKICMSISLIQVQKAEIRYFNPFFLTRF